MPDDKVRARYSRRVENVAQIRRRISAGSDAFGRSPARAKAGSIVETDASVFGDLGCDASPARIFGRRRSHPGIDNDCGRTSPPACQLDRAPTYVEWAVYGETVRSLGSADGRGHQNDWQD